MFIVKIFNESVQCTENTPQQDDSGQRKNITSNSKTTAAFVCFVKYSTKSIKKSLYRNPTV